MPAVPVPELLDQLAAAGGEGVIVERSPSLDSELDLLARYGFPVHVEAGRVRLALDYNLLVPLCIEQETPRLSWDRLTVRGFLELESTNQEVLNQSRRGAPHGLLVYAEHQTSGRGRKGRRWISLPGAGLSFTLLLRPSRSIQDWPILTHAASVALVNAIDELVIQGLLPRALPLGLKWPNDVLIAEKKTAGILLESTRGVNGRTAAALGIGINVAPESTPQELEDIATSIGRESGVAVPRRLLLVRFLYHFQLLYDLFELGNSREILERWKRRSTMWEGVPILVTEGEQSRPAVTCGLSDTGALKIRTASGEEETLLAGDVTIRRVTGEGIR